MVTIAKFQLQEGAGNRPDPTGSAVRHDVTNTHTIASGIQSEVVNTLAVVSDSRRKALKGPEDTRGQNRMVSTVRTLPVAE